MFESRPAATPPLAPAIIAATPGYVLLHWPKKPVGKVNINVVNEVLQQNLYPIVAWKLQGDKLEPLTIAPPADGFVRYLVMPGGRIFDLNNPAQRWANFDQFAQYLLQQWRKSLGQTAVEPPQPSGTHYAVRTDASPALIPTGFS
jgi:hypothetical protein